MKLNINFRTLKPSLMPTSAKPDAVFVYGSGSYLYDENNKPYIDLIQGWAVNTLGHAAPELSKALLQQSSMVINPGPAFFNTPALTLAKKLTDHSCFDHVFFCSSGAEANEGAIKLARKWGQLHKNGAYEVISFSDGFHGRTLTTMAASGKAGWENLFQPKTEGFRKAIFNDIDSVKALITEKTVAIMLEPIQGEAGVIPATIPFVLELKLLCQQHELLLIFDEVQTGCGRTGDLFAYEYYGIEPDIMTLAKGIGGGVPLAALLSKKWCSCFEHGDQGGTYSANALMCAAGNAIMDRILIPGFLKNVRMNGQHFSKRLTELSKRYQLGKVRGRGMLLALDVGTLSALEISAIARENGLLVNAPRNNLLRFMPALNIGAYEIDDAITILDKTIKYAIEKNQPVQLT